MKGFTQNHEMIKGYCRNVDTRYVYIVILYYEHVYLQRDFNSYFKK